MALGSLSWGRGFLQQQRMHTVPVWVWVPHPAPILLTITINGDISLLLCCGGGRGKATPSHKATPQSRVRGAETAAKRGWGTVMVLGGQREGEDGTGATGNCQMPLIPLHLNSCSFEGTFFLFVSSIFPVQHRKF